MGVLYNNEFNKSEILSQSKFSHKSSKQNFLFEKLDSNQFSKFHTNNA